MLKMIFKLLKLYVYFRLFIWMLNKEAGEGGGMRSREEHGKSGEGGTAGSTGEPTGSAGVPGGAGRTSDIPISDENLGIARM